MQKNIAFDCCDISSVRNAIKELKGFKKELKENVSNALSKLADDGIAVAEANCGDFGSHISFSKEYSSNGQTVKIVAKNMSDMLVVWSADKNVSDTKTATISPLLMAEFGSGGLAENIYGVPGVGKGTFPSHTNSPPNINHAKNRDSWFYYDMQGNLRMSKGIKPTHPMHRAALEIVKKSERLEL